MKYINSKFEEELCILKQQLQNVIKVN